MTQTEATELIRPGILPSYGTWADIGAGTGMFTKALMEVLESAFADAVGQSLWRPDEASSDEGGNVPFDKLRARRRVYAVDKSPHALWELKPTSNVELEIVEADFNYPIALPPLDGIVMANALHYAKDHLTVMKNVLRCLKPKGTFILVEYKTETPRPPWVPNPVSFRVFAELCTLAGLIQPEVIGTLPSQYGFEQIYAAITRLPRN